MYVKSAQWRTKKRPTTASRRKATSAGSTRRRMSARASAVTPPRISTAEPTPNTGYIHSGSLTSSHPNAAQPLLSQLSYKRWPSPFVPKNGFWNGSLGR